jgi:two-component system, OmpR family, sensor histidine kinase KdpD
VSEPDGRPDPDVLLERVKAEAAKAARARLRVYLGYAPGVGKTYTMLESARRLRAQGTEVVVGLVETHGRAETEALLEGLEVLPRRQLTYRGVDQTEFDLDAALARRPAVILLDELAHTNVPGSRHTKRWQDALELLDAGIDVHTTLNIQHVDSLNDLIAQITFVQVRETVPDSMLERADEIELVDLTPDELLARLSEGKVYVPEQAQRAAGRFFRRGNLLALRELALRRTAERVDADVVAYRREHAVRTTWPASERILVCVGPSPSSERLIRSARRMAAGLRAPWVAVTVEARETRAMKSADRDRVQAHLRLAESLGGETARLSGNKVSAEILRHARDHNVTRIIVGKPAHPRRRDIVRGSLVDELVRGSGEIEVHFVSGDEPPAVRSDRERADRVRVRWKDYVLAAALVGAITALSVAVHPVLASPDVAMLYLFAIVAAALFLGRGPSVAAAALSVAAYDFFSVPPYLTFSVESAKHFLTFATMFALGLGMSALVSRIKRHERDARAREQRTSALYALSRELVGVTDATALAQASVTHAANVFGGEAALLLPDARGTLGIAGASRAGIELTQEDLAVARWTAEHARPAGRGTDTLTGARVACLPLLSGGTSLGVLALLPVSVGPLDMENRRFLEAFVRQVTLALEREAASEEARAAALRARSEEMRSSLLSAVSHDLRTPLAAITGAATALRDEQAGLTPLQRTELVDTVCAEAERMERLIANVLDMMRLESGATSPKREWVPLEEVVGSALDRLADRLGGRPLSLALPQDLPLLSLDPVLFEHVLVNLIDNALRYTPPEATIGIAARASETMIEIDVFDSGPGIPAGEEELVFDKFHRGPHAPSGGVGLGLSICRGIVHAHGGTIAASNRPRGGALLRIHLPRTGTPPRVVEEDGRSDP